MGRVVGQLSHVKRLVDNTLEKRSNYLPYSRLHLMFHSLLFSDTCKNMKFRMANDHLIEFHLIEIVIFHLIEISIIT